jgi:class 3 adenylate cyclase
MEVPTGTVTILFTDVEGSTRLYEPLMARGRAMNEQEAMEYAASQVPSVTVPDRESVPGDT